LCTLEDFGCNLDSAEIKRVVQKLKDGSRVPRTQATQEQEHLFSIS
jgi:hypothetical protein